MILNAATYMAFYYRMKLYKTYIFLKEKNTAILCQHLIHIKVPNKVIYCRFDKI